MNNFAVITKAEQDVAKAKEHLSVLKQKITDSKKKLEEAKADYESNIDSGVVLVYFVATGRRVQNRG